MNVQEARAQWAKDLPHMLRLGVILPEVQSYLPPEFQNDFDGAMDALPALTTTPNSGIPSFLTTMVDPEVFEILFAPTEGADILGEVRRGDWTMQTSMFPTLEHVGQVSAYGDRSESGHTGANANWPQRQSFLFQTIKEYGELELARAGAARIAWSSELDKAAATIMNRFMNLTYFFGVKGLQNYGLVNDPNLPAPISPSSKGAGGTQWIVNGRITASANEIYADIQALFIDLVTRTTGLVKKNDPLVLTMSPTVAVALTAANGFNVSVTDLLKKAFPNLEVKDAVQFGATSASNPQGIAGGNLVQMIAPKVGGQNVGFCAFNEKMRAHRVIPAASSFKQKITGGSWGAIIRQPFAYAQMLGV